MPRAEHSRFGFSHRFACLCSPQSSDEWELSVVVGPDWKALVCTVVLVVGSAVVYVAHTSQSTARGVAVSLLAFSTLGFLLRCALTEPGILPLQPPPLSMPPMIVREASPELGGGLVAVERRWCTACNLYRPLRAVHCRFCNVCILRRDHHCPWTGTCVGERNYRYYIGFIVSALLSATVLVLGTVLDLVDVCDRWHHMNPTSNWTDAAKSGFRHIGVLGVVVFLVAVMAVVMLLNLVTYHWYLIRHDATTSEENKGGAYLDHPFSSGSRWLNMRKVLFGAHAPSLLGWRGNARLLEILAVKPIDAEEFGVDEDQRVPTPKTPTESPVEASIDMPPVMNTAVVNTPPT